MKLINELRILIAELLFLQAVRIMPLDAPEAKSLEKAYTEYTVQALQHARWVKFPS